MCAGPCTLHRLTEHLTGCHIPARSTPLFPGEGLRGWGGEVPPAAPQVSPPGQQGARAGAGAALLPRALLNVISTTKASFLTQAPPAQRALPFLLSSWHTAHRLFT